jgi:hypothetical protein
MMPYYALLGFLRLKNIWVKITLGRVKNNRDSQPKLHTSIFGFFLQKRLLSGTIFRECQVV